eukprot:10876148-Alexandrium_andersonii.AAC.1
MQAAREPEALAAAWFCEKDAVLAATVERAWQTRAQQGQVTPYRRGPDDVWGLLRDDAAALRA